ncbi:fumarylacetoacetate hydrolase family protein [Limnohabitans sp.]|uniref:fumarylacetoacetate hydrolase family protein n=1 Tax=Limnohabitans sp. TaxID=1907725 RepID=UPI0038BCA24F
MTAHIPSPDLPIHGTVYGVLLNSQAEWQVAAPLMSNAPYQAPPKAPVLYIKTANTWTLSEHAIAVPSHVSAVEIGATLGVVLSEEGALRGYVLLNDLSVPHSVAEQGFYRPPVKYKCIDGFLGVGAQLLPAVDLPAPHAITLQVRINGTLRQTVQLGQMRRRLPQLLADVGEFMTLQAGDVLMLGLDICHDGPESGHRPHAVVGDVVEIDAPGVPGLGVLRHHLIGAVA